MKLGDTVHFNVVEGVALPAVIVKIWPGAHVVNLQVFQNGDGGLKFVSSVNYCNDPVPDTMCCYPPVEYEDEEHNILSAPEVRDEDRPHVRAKDYKPVDNRPFVQFPPEE